LLPSCNMSVMKRDQDYSVYKKEAVKKVTFSLMRLL